MDPKWNDEPLSASATRYHQEAGGRTAGEFRQRSYTIAHERARQRRRALSRPADGLAHRLAIGFKMMGCEDDE
jgi:hypothetical protein